MPPLYCLHQLLLTKQGQQEEIFFAAPTTRYASDITSLTDTMRHYVGGCDWEIFYTRSSGRSALLLLAPAEGWGALRAPRALRALLGAFGPS